MATQYLYPRSRQFEMLAAIFALGLGLVLWGSHGGAVMPILGHWTKDALGLLLVFAAIIHATGIRINGRWRWSPFLRSFGMGIHFLVVGFLTLTLANTALVTYISVCLTLFMLYGFCNTLQDTRRAIQNKKPTIYGEPMWSN